MPEPYHGWDEEWNSYENTRLKCEADGCAHVHVAGTIWATQCDHITSPYLMCAGCLYAHLSSDEATRNGKPSMVCITCEKPIRLLQVVPARLPLP